jgi:hypothetical protein
MGANLKFEIRESIYSILALAVVDSLLIGFCSLYYKYFVENWGWLIYILGLIGGICFLAYELSKLIKRKIIMRIDSSGIYHKDCNLIKWDDILWIKRTKRGNHENERVVFMIQTTQSNKPHEISISDLEASEKMLISYIRKFRAFNVTEFEQD